METIFEAMKTFFEEDDWKADKLDDRPVLKMGFNGDHGQWNCYAQARDEQHQFVFYSVAPVKVDEELRQPMAEFIARANYGMILGNFELDFNDGEVRYKTAIDVEGESLSDELVKHCVYPNVLTMDKYLRGIMAVASGAADPTVAIALVEGE